MEYSIKCHKGKVREKNQDNFWCDCNYLNYENSGLDKQLFGFIERKKCPVFAVFDGMGGEQKGEYAAYLAAYSFNNMYSQRKKKKAVNYLWSVFIQANKKICEYAREHKFRTVGTTGVALLIKRKVFASNIGDSRIYCSSGGKLIQISVDHCMRVASEKKAPLTQYLGIPEKEFFIQPHFTKRKWQTGERYLLCTDGLTDMVSAGKINQILSDAKTVDECSELLLKQALDNGGIDNITVMVCELVDKKRKGIAK